MAKKQKVRAAAVQIAPDLTSGAATLDRVIAAIEEAEIGRASCRERVCYAV